MANHRATEDAMPVLRIATAGAALLLLTAGSAIAQPTSPATGKPITLLNILTLPDKTKIKPHSHRLVASTWKTHVAAVHQRPRHLAAVAMAATARPDVWPSPEPIEATRVAAADSEQQGTANVAEAAPNELVVGGRAIQVVSPDDANEIDLAADTAEVPPTKGPRGDFAYGVRAVEPSAETAVAAPAKAPNPVGTSAWVAQLLAAVGGAMAAASVAWFLIGSAPQRRYD
jgi:hypothetical protein